MAGIVTAEANRLLDAALGVAAYTAPTTPMKLALATSAPSASAAGTEVAGGGYSRQTIPLASNASAGSISNSGAVTFTNMPAATTSHVDIYDNNGSPRRAFFGALTAPKTTGAGDVLTFAIGALVISLS